MLHKIKQYKHWEKFLISAGITGLVVAILLGGILFFTSTGGSWYNSITYEVISGKVIDKKKVDVSYWETYACGTYTTYNSSTKRTETHTKYCERYVVMFDYRVYSQAGNFHINRVDYHGYIEPPRYSIVKIGEPVANVSTYKNRVRGNEFSIYNKQGMSIPRYENLIPEYPINQYDYYHVDRFVSIGSKQNAKAWNDSLALLNAEVGPAKKANVIVVITNVQDPNITKAIEYKWKGGNLNDIIVVIGSADDKKVDWVRVSSWATKGLLKAQLRSDLEDVGTLDKDKVLAIVKQDVMTYFIKKKSSEFNYLDI